MLDPARIRELAQSMDEEEVPPMSAEQAEQVARLLTADRPVLAKVSRIGQRLGASGAVAAVLLTGASMATSEFLSYAQTALTPLVGGLVIA